MKIVTAAEMARLEHHAFQLYGADMAGRYMDEAGRQVAREVEEFIAEMGVRDSSWQIYLLCGRGNNAGDAYRAGTLLRTAGFKVTALTLASEEELSPLCRQQARHFTAAGGLQQKAEDLTSCARPGLIIDGIFGRGFKPGKPLPASYTQLISRANSSGLAIISIDLPSGLYDEPAETAGDHPYRVDEAIRASRTISVGLPAQAFFYGKAWDLVGQLRVVNFGLPAEIIADARGTMELITPSLVGPLLPKLVPTRHKYQAGMLSLGAGAGSGMTGAATLAGTAAMRSGCGIVHWFLPENMHPEIKNCPSEIVTHALRTPRLDTGVKDLFTRAQACLLGPGMGSKPRSYSLLREMLRANQAPLVLDADALTLYGEKPFPLHTPTILTPHLGELQRLMQLSHKPRLSPIFLASVQKFAEKIGATIIVKGMPTYVVHPGKSIYCSSVGNPGMATAGSGDVLAGIVAALLAQGLEPQQAALLGVYLHGTAGDAAAAELSPYCMMASDIIAHLPGVFKELGGLGCVSP